MKKSVFEVPTLVDPCYTQAPPMLDVVLTGSLSSLREKPSELYRRVLAALAAGLSTVEVSMKGFKQQVAEGMRRLDGASWGKESPMGEVVAREGSGFRVKFSAGEVLAYLESVYTWLKAALASSGGWSPHAPEPEPALG